jgi:hypothetical protein
VTSLVHPEIIDGRRLWLDPAMQDVIDKLHNGDPVKGWDGDPRLEVYCTPTGDGPVWELWRLEDDNEYRMTCRSKPGVPFDDRLIEHLVAHDRRRFKTSLHEQIKAKNEAIDADIRRRNDDYINEEVNPRLDWALKKDGLL